MIDIKALAACDPAAEPSATDAAWRRQQAAEWRVAASRADGEQAADLQGRAEGFDTEANAILRKGLTPPNPVPLAAGGEVAGAPGGSEFIDRLRTDPDLVGIDASRHRLSLIGASGMLAMALDAAETVQARNSIEKILAHQIAAAHQAGMRLHFEALELLRAFGNTGFRNPAFSVEAARLMKTSARMMEVTQKGALCLQRLHSGGQQTVVVQHVHVAEGGQAVVAGAVKTSRRGTAHGG